ncbi:ABC transporter ATP-binding protein [Sesbania bispinosa]|nr:ABC transporter ATP-binding protein [Sesbania bispinosa]
MARWSVTTIIRNHKDILDIIEVSFLHVTILNDAHLFANGSLDLVTLETTNNITLWIWRWEHMKAFTEV